MTQSEIVRHAFEAFREEVAAPPPLTLRGAGAIDSYDRPQPFDPDEDAPTDAYLEGFAFWGVIYLDAQSWRHYLPRLIEYALTRPDDPAMTAEALVRSLRPPDRYPARLASLSGEQEAVVRSFLQTIAIEHPSTSVQEEAQQALEEWWLPNPRARPTAAEIEARRHEPVTYREIREDVYRLSVPSTITGSGVRDIPSESRRVQTWGGYLCGDVHATLAINIRPLTAQSLQEAVAALTGFFEIPAVPRPIDVTGASRAVRLDGVTTANHPGDPQAVVLIVAEADELVTLTVRTWEREDVGAEVERIVRSFEVVRAAR